jgi:hypothetical protein
VKCFSPQEKRLIQDVQGNQHQGNMNTESRLPTQEYPEVSGRNNLNNKVKEHSKKLLNE